MTKFVHRNRNILLTLMSCVFLLIIIPTEGKKQRLRHAIRKGTHTAKVHLNQIGSHIRSPDGKVYEVVKKELGKGAFGTVGIVKDTSNPEEYLVMKYTPQPFEKTDLTEEKLKSQLHEHFVRYKRSPYSKKTEIRIQMGKIKSMIDYLHTKKAWEDEVAALKKVESVEQITKIRDSFYDEKAGFVIILDFYNMGDLYQNLKYMKRRQNQQYDKEDMSDNEMCGFLKILREVETGLKAMHDLKLSHSDVKPENIMIKDTGVEAGKVLDDTQKQAIETNRWTAAVGDLGLAETLTEQKARNAQEGRPQVFGDIVGTPGFIPPEQKATTPVYSKDMFALGAIVSTDFFDRPTTNREFSFDYPTDQRMKYPDPSTLNPYNSFEKTESLREMFYDSSVCYDTLTEIIKMTVMRNSGIYLNLRHRSSDEELLTFIDKGLEKSKARDQEFNTFFKNRAVGFVKVQKKKTTDWSPTFLHSQTRDILFTPSVGRIYFDDVYKCTGEYRADTPYLFWKSRKQTQKWSCFPVEKIEKNSESSILVTSKDTTSYIFTFKSDTECSVGIKCKNVSPDGKIHVAKIVEMMQPNQGSTVNSVGSAGSNPLYSGPRSSSSSTWTDRESVGGTPSTIRPSEKKPYAYNLPSISEAGESDY